MVEETPVKQRNRYAVYAMPPADHPLAETAARWLGRDPYHDRTVPFDPVDGENVAERAEIVAAAARYGFHGTLMAPFSPAQDLGESDLAAAVAALASTLRPVTIPELNLIRLGDFFALGPSLRVIDLDRLAAHIVADCQVLRAPLDAAELARRRKAHLTPEEDANLVAWGYPYVFDAFRYHMTLTGPVPESEAAKVENLLRKCFAAFVGKPLSSTQSPFASSRSRMHRFGSIRPPG